MVREEPGRRDGARGSGHPAARCLPPAGAESHPAGGDGPGRRGHVRHRADHHRHVHLQHRPDLWSLQAGR